MRSSAPEPPGSPKRNRRALLWVSLGTAALLLGVGAVAFSTIDLLHVHFGYDKAAARYKAAGMPWTAADLAGPAIPDGRNAGPRLFALAKKFEGLEPKDAPKHVGLLNPDSAKGMADYLAPRTKLLDEYRPLAGLQARWDKDWDLGPDLLFPEFAQLKEMMRAFSYRAELKSFRGDVKGSCEDLSLGASLAKQTGGGGLLIGHLVEIAGRSMLLLSARKAATYHLDDPVALESFAKAVKQFEPDPTVAAGLRQEAYMGMTVLRNTGVVQMLKAADYRVESGEPQPFIRDPKKVVRDGDPPSFLNRSFAVPLLNAWAEVGETIKAKGESLDTMVEVAKMMDRTASESKGLSALMMQILFPVFNQAANAGLKTAADKRTTYAALKIAAAQARRRSLSPGDLAALLPEDPYTHQPMKALVEGSSVKVWSLAEDKLDNQGVSRNDARYLRSKGGPESEKDPPYDYVSELPWKPSLTTVASSGNAK